MYLVLDRNVIAKIKLILDDRYFSENDHEKDRKKKIQCISKLRYFDRKNNTIILLPAFIEGGSGVKESRKLIESTIDRDTPAIKKFFKFAKSDSGFFVENKSYVSLTFEGYFELDFPGYFAFLKEALPLISQNLSFQDCIKREVELIELAHAQAIYTSHPVFLLCLFSLYGSKVADKILKSKGKIKDINRHIHNILSDALIISRLSSLQKHISYYKKSACKYITYDKYLEKFLRACRTESIGESRQDSYYSHSTSIVIDINLLENKRGGTQFIKEAMKRIENYKSIESKKATQVFLRNRSWEKHMLNLHQISDLIKSSKEQKNFWKQHFLDVKPRAIQSKSR